MILRDGGKIISDTEKVADTFSTFFWISERLCKLAKVTDF